MIRKRVVLFRIQNLKQGRGRIAAIICAELVYLIEHHHGVIHAGAANRLNDAARHRAHVRTSMATKFRFVTNAAQA